MFRQSDLEAFKVEKRAFNSVQIADNLPRTQ